MKEKLKKWRNNLTLRQKVIMWIIGGIIYVLLYISLICLAKVDNLAIRAIVGITLLVLTAIGFLTVMLSIATGIVVVLKRLTDKKLLECYKEKLSENDFTEVFFKSQIMPPQGTAGEFYCDMKHCKEPHWLAKWQEEKIYLLLKDEDKKIRDWNISNFSFFDRLFEFKA